MTFLQTTFLENTAQSWLIGVGMALAAFLVLRVAVSMAGGRFARLSERTKNRWDDILSAAFQKTKSLVLLVFALLVGAIPLTLPSDVMDVLKAAAAIAFILQVGLWLNGAVGAWVATYREERLEEDAAGVMSMNLLAILARLVIWSLVLLLSLENVGVDVTALVAGLGIGGIAVALAAQNVLGDVFASLSIVIDKPFVLGDFLIVGEHLGSVEQIGIKTTRLRSLSGEQLIFSNGDLLGSRVRNYGRMYERRVPFKIGVTYQTPREKLAKIPDLLREAVETLGEEQVRFDRAHFQSYGDFALTFETVYYVLSPDYNQYMDCQQAINLKIHESFEARGIEFAYPTQTLFLMGDGHREAS
ncbi:MAG: mechanosensitive ion channel family protein [Gemmatimonadota bacterium]|jgi:small-conductance mechanosensitive channel